VVSLAFGMLTMYNGMNCNFKMLQLVILYQLVPFFSYFTVKYQQMVLENSRLPIGTELLEN